jgi:O-acetyl-ADP-ribose deacetylase (regulator of RNase III)
MGINTVLKIIQGDITKIPVDAIVNAANAKLAGGGGVDGAIHRAGGPSIMKELDEIREKQGGCPTGQCVVTRAGKLPAQWVIHAVGPVWKGGKHNEDELLGSAYYQSLLAARQAGAKTVSFPNISTGVYGYPKERAAQIAIQTVSNFVKENPDVFEEILFVCFDKENYDIYQKLLKNVGI